MTNKLLLPNKLKKVGWFLFIPATILGLLVSLNDFQFKFLQVKAFAMFSDQNFGPTQSFQYITTNLTNTIVGIVFIIGALFVGFSREKKEDEFIAKLRLSSLLWAIWVNYFLLFLAFLFVYGTPFLTVMVYNMFTVLIIFITRFNFILYRNFKSMADEK